MKAILIICIASLFSLNAQAEFRLDKINKTVVGGHPESVIVSGQYVYVSNLGERIEDNDGDGYVSRLSTNGKPLQKNILPSTIRLDNPTGMAIVSDVLFIVDSSRILGISKSRMNPIIIDLKSTGASRLNDPTVVAPGYLLVSEAEQKRLYLINVKTGSFQAINYDTRYGHPNGLHYDANAGVLFVVANKVNTITDDPRNGALLAFSFSARTRGQLSFLWSQDYGYFLDGVQRIGATQSVLVTDWVSMQKNGRLGIYSIDQGRFVQNIALDALGSADFWLHRNGALYVPDLVKGTLDIYSMKSTR